MTAIRVWTHANLATQKGPSPYGLVEDGVLAIEGERIIYAGAAEGFDIPSQITPQSLGGRLVTPGLIDCHTHLVYGGSRAQEFSRRLNGESYAEISRTGGGIASTVAATRAASDDELVAASLKRLDQMIARGATTVEVKSGYGLDHDTELRMLRVARKLSQLRQIRIKTTFLGAHAIPRGMDSDAYLDEICLPALRQAARDGLVDAVDGFCETIAFTPAQIDRVFKVAAELGLPIKLHAEQLSSQGGASLAARRGALSADHLEHASPDDIDAMAKAGTVAVLLPGAYYTLRDTTPPPVAGFRAAGVPMAIATDANPGSSPMTSLPLAMNMAATLFGLTPDETLAGVTRHAARALGLDEVGTLAPGAIADLAIWDTDDPAELTYRVGDTPLFKRVFGGHEC